MERLPPKITGKLGNWYEERLYREEKLAKFLSNVKSGKVDYKRSDSRMKLANTPTDVSSEFLIGSKVMIRSLFSNGYISAVIPDTYPAIKLDDKIEIAVSGDQDPREGKARSCFVFHRQSNDPSKFVKWEENVYITTQLPGLDKVVRRKAN